MPTPGKCPYETRTLKVGREVKSCCDIKGEPIWTNCRECGRCLFMEPESDQLCLFEEV